MFFAGDNEIDTAVLVAEDKRVRAPSIFLLSTTSLNAKLIQTCLLILAFYCCVVTASAQSKPSKTEQQLIQLERDIGQANIRRDKAFFERVEADEFIFTDSSGGITTKAEDVASLDKPAGELKLVAYDLAEVRVKLYGSTAVVTGLATSTYRGKDRDVVLKNRFTDVFVKRSGRWQIVAGHSSRIREPQK